MKEQNDEYLQVKFFQAHSRMTEGPQILILARILARRIPYKTSSQLQTIADDTSYWSRKETTAPHFAVATISDQSIVTQCTESGKDSIHLFYKGKHFISQTIF